MKQKIVLALIYLAGVALLTGLAVMHKNKETNLITNKLDSLSVQMADITKQQTYPNNTNLVMMTMNAHLKRCNVWCGKEKHVVNFTIDAKAVVYCECAR